MTESERLIEAEKLLSEIEKRFPNWRSFRDLIDCIDITLYQRRNLMGIEMERDSLLVEREKTHGRFEDNAKVWQAICEMAGKTRFQNDSQRCAFNLIALKIARMIQTPQVKDHWDDIVGYAKLGSEACD